MKDRVKDKFQRVWKNQQKEQRAEALRDFKLMLERPSDPWRKSVYRLWSDEELRQMVKLLEESLS